MPNKLIQTPSPDDKHRTHDTKHPNVCRRRKRERFVSFCQPSDPTKPPGTHFNAAYPPMPGRRGLDVIPNRHFWAELPVLVRDGFVFTWRTARGLNRANAEERTPLGGSSAAPKSEPLMADAADAEAGEMAAPPVGSTGGSQSSATQLRRNSSAGALTAAEMDEYTQLKAKGQQGTINKAETARFVALKKKKKRGK